MTEVKRVQESPDGGGFILGVATDDIAVRRYRRPDGTIAPEVGGDGQVHIFASLSRGQVVEKAVEGGTTVRRIGTGEVSIDRPDAVSRYIVRGASDIIQISLKPGETGPLYTGPSVPRLDEPEPGLETLAYRVAQAIWLGEAEDALFLSSVSARALELLGRRKVSSNGGLSSHHARLVVESIEAHVVDPKVGPLTLAVLASATGLSVYHFSRAFGQTFGASPYRFALRRRLARARDLLVDGTLDLRDISHLTGFSSVPHLTAAFGREMGVPPARFRKLLRTLVRSE